MDIDNFFVFYRTEFVPAYSDLVGYIGDKPQQTLIELENTLAHISQHFNPRLDTKDKAKNLEKAYDHLVRVTLDCYKLLWVNIYERLEVIDKNKFNRKLGLNISEEDFRTKLQKLRKLAQEARRIEMTSLGLDPIAPLDKYKEVVKGGYELIDTIDENKMQEIRSLKRFVSTKEFIIGMAVGILAGLISGYLLYLFIASPAQ
ncbi:MAG: hypothetical protein EF812_06465 [Methanosarcinales archaeon]|nr:MAG: hypothetical protein EF812_06465 [Methanosarcinales archaeon]